MGNYYLRYSCFDCNYFDNKSQENDSEITALTKLSEAQKVQTDTIIKILKVLQKNDTTLSRQLAFMEDRGRKEDEANYEKSMSDIWDFYKMRQRVEVLQFTTMNDIVMRNINLPIFRKILDDYQGIATERKLC